VSRRLVIDDGRSQRELLLVGSMLVGRSTDCEISHADPRLSRRHAEISVTADGVVVRDLQSRNGIRVNGRPVQEAVLQPGDAVQVAHLELKFYDDSVDAAAARPRSSLPPGMAAPVVAPAVEDDRTRVLSSGAVATVRATSSAVTAVHEPLDDRTRVASAARPVPVPPTGLPPALQPTLPDVGELLIRAAPQPPPSPAPPADLSVQWLVTRGWGRRVLVQGLLLALIVFGVTAVPLLGWQRRAGIPAFQSWAVLVPAALAAGFAGVMVASLIARTTARGLGNQGR
jgi:pSer/pThr/pTyr-binding forkhead associated (FHA) protein